MQNDELAVLVGCLSERLDPAAIWLFGSQAEGRATERSDVDVAVLPRAPLDPLVLLETRGELAARLGRDVDLVDLRRASPLVAMAVIREGRLLAQADPVGRASWACTVPGRWADLRRVRRPAEQALARRFRDG